MWQYDVFNGSDGYCEALYFITLLTFITIDNDAGSSGIELVHFLKVVFPEVMDLNGEIMEIE